jgi:AhpD family alkylhydroperoxidase
VTGLRELAPDAYRAMRGLEGALWLEPRLRELVEVRVALLSGHADAAARHAREALELGETQERLACLSGWRRSGLFDARERAALALADAVALGPGRAIAARRREAAEQFDEAELAQLVVACVAARARNGLELAFEELSAPRLAARPA